MNTYECKRCGLDCHYRSHILKHLNRTHPCKPLVSDISTNELLSQLPPEAKKKYSCKICGKAFPLRQTKYVHQKSCTNYAPSILTDPVQSKLEELQSKIVELETKLTTDEPKDSTPVNTKLLLELQYYKNRKNENFYQMLVEEYLGGTHKSLECGITDVTTDTCHAEVKEWKSWKEAVGQLTCYNAVDPKQDLAMYMFGKYTDSCKDKASKIATNCGFKVYEFTEDPDGKVCIKNCSNDELVYTYIPSL